MSDRVVIVSPYFPPSTLAGVHRARHLAKHLPTVGWTPTVLCVDEAYHEERLDADLAALLPADLDLVKVAAVPAAITRRVGLGEIGLRAYAQLADGLRQTIRTRRPQAVMITGSPYYPMLLARMVKRDFELPVVLDFQDPWVSAWGASHPLLTKWGVTHALAKRLEPIALRHADFVTSVSDQQNRDMAGRYPWLDASRMAALPIGGDPDDYSAIDIAGNSDAGLLAPDKINMVYVGTFLPRSDGVLKALFSALAELRVVQPMLVSRLRFTFVGTSNQTNGQGRRRVKPLAEAAGVGDLVVEIPERVPYLTALSALREADTILLLGSDEPHYTASKIYPALLSRRPCLGVFHQSSSAFDILTQAGEPVIGFQDEADLEVKLGSLMHALAEAVLCPRPCSAARQTALEPYQAAAIAARFAKIFTELKRC